MIPKIFHFIWIGHNKPWLKGIQSKIALYGTSFRYILWTDNLSIDIKNLPIEIRNINEISSVNINFNDTYTINNIEALKSDWYRMLILYKWGGIYSDLDSISIRKIPENLFNYDYVTSYEWSVVNKDNYSGAIIGFIMASPHSEAIRNFLVIRKTIPYSISSVKIGLLFGDISGVKLLSPEAFCPIRYNEINNTTSCNFIRNKFPNCYEFHLYHGYDKNRDITN